MRPFWIVFVHQAAEPVVVGAFNQVDHLVNYDILETLGVLFA